MADVFVAVTFRCEACGFEAEARAELSPSGQLELYMPTTKDAGDRHWDSFCDFATKPGEPRWRTWCDRARCRAEYEKAKAEHDAKAAEWSGAFFAEVPCSAGMIAYGPTPQAAEANARALWEKAQREAHGADEAKCAARTVGVEPIMVEAPLGPPPRGFDTVLFEHADGKKERVPMEDVPRLLAEHAAALEALPSYLPEGSLADKIRALERWAAAARGKEG